ncbi:hypothetical protein [Pseudofrankia sp. BMG5.37]|uniref:hypothetical protein n=1 Tax=Pseudofrankia sp. BMG5.37 TaxID=3050035 RepID=UPI0028953219|nr:hypothetical protein [Pseudofrankia sp. BMG5.37]MDT3440295.1 hypothetical protein [Pseudofrankia sp. BMG5.37]
MREEYERAFHDSLFGHFEELAESCGLLVDISEQMQSEDAASVSGEIPAGTLVRITGPTCLFDSGYLRSSFKNIINVARGLSSLGGGDAPVVRTGQNKGQRPRQNGLGRARGGIEPDERDAMVSKMLDGMEPSSIGSLAEVVEGLFPDGIWAIQRLGPDRDVLISARCSATSEYLEKDRNALFSRYGVGYSQWTMVGLVGSRDSLVPETDLTITDTNGVLDRAKIVDVILGLMALIGATGFAEAPQGNNFAVTPLGIYRIVTPWAPSAARKPS